MSKTVGEKMGSVSQTSPGCNRGCLHEKKFKNLKLKYVLLYIISEETCLLPSSDFCWCLDADWMVIWVSLKLCGCVILCFLQCYRATSSKSLYDVAGSRNACRLQMSQHCVWFLNTKSQRRHLNLSFRWLMKLQAHFTQLSLAEGLRRYWISIF